MPALYLGIKVAMYGDLANMFFLESWGTEYNKWHWMRTKGEIPIYFGPDLQTHPDLANLQVNPLKKKQN